MMNCIQNSGGGMSDIFAVDLAGFFPEIIEFLDVLEEDIECILFEFRKLMSEGRIACFTHVTDPGENPARFELHVDKKFWEVYQEMETYVWTKRYQKLLCLK